MVRSKHATEKMPTQFLNAFGTMKEIFHGLATTVLPRLMQVILEGDRGSGSIETYLESKPLARCPCLDQYRNARRNWVTRTDFCEYEE